ncbi:MAG TPA: glycosyl hydrolase, partial [Gemmatimonadaceae bacterium]|nr:glycosyl hydrolase [Gemmatimonadaceae bacterium]
MSRRRACVRLLIAPALATVVGSSIVSAQTATRSTLASVDPALFKGLRYRMVGPNRGGRVTAVAGVATEPATFYMGVASGGVWKTTDAGQNWFPVSDGKIPVASIGAIEVASSDPSVVYVGTGSDDIRSNVSIGRGVYRSIDGGQTWSFAGLRDVGQIGAVRVHP